MIYFHFLSDILHAPIEMHNICGAATDRTSDKDVSLVFPQHHEKSDDIHLNNSDLRIVRN